MRKRYIYRLIGRCIILVLCVLMWWFNNEELNIIKGLNFFNGFSVLHILWVIWVIDMLLQLLPVRTKIPLGSQKHMGVRFVPVKKMFNVNAMKEYVVSTTKAAYKVMLLWTALIAVIGTLFYKNVIDEKILFLITVVFYVCDLICVLVWCPFRLLMKTRCCTTCRIFNWDHLMMFSPMIFVAGFYGWSLFIMSLAVWIVWELCVFIYPERFWEYSNDALKCSSCTDKLCTQYCKKLISNEKVEQPGVS